MDEEKERDILSEIGNYKQINEDLELGKTCLLDYNNNKQECNIFGIPLIKYYRNVTGQQSYKSRLNRNLIKKIEYKSPQYLPNTSHLVGSSMCPRPISIPFINQNEKSEKLIDKIKKEKIYNFKKNKNIFDLEKPMKDSKCLPSYLCVKLGADSPKTRNHLINLFDEYIQNKKKKYNNDPKYYLKDSSLNGVIYYKTFLKNNLNKNLFNGNKIPYTNQKDINSKFKIIKNLIKKEGWNTMHLERNNINHDIYTKLYKINRVGDKNNIFKKNYSSINSFEIKKSVDNISLFRENDNDIDNIGCNKKIESYSVKRNNNKKLLNALITPRNDDININSCINYAKKKSRQKILYESNSLLNDNHNDKKYISFQNNFNRSIRFGSTITTGFNYNNESKISKNYVPIQKDLYTPQMIHNFQRSLSNFNIHQKQPLIINDENNNEEVEENDEDDDEITNISDSQDMIKKKKITKLREIKDNCDHENKLLEGYQDDYEKEELYENHKKKKHDYVSPVTVYKKEYELFQKVNPIQYERELKKKLFDDKMLLKKLQNRKIYERIKIKK